jgi:hypothetical protein
MHDINNSKSILFIVVSNPLAILHTPYAGTSQACAQIYLDFNSMQQSKFCESSCLALAIYHEVACTL